MIIDLSSLLDLSTYWYTQIQVVWYLLFAPTNDDVFLLEPAGENVSVALLSKICIKIYLLLFFPIGQIECTKVDQGSKHNKSKLFSTETNNISIKPKNKKYPPVA